MFRPLLTIETDTEPENLQIKDNEQTKITFSTY